MNRIIVVCLLLGVHSISFSQMKLESREEKLQQLKNRNDIKVTEIQKDILKMEYPNGKVLYKDISDYKKERPSIQYPASNIPKPTYSPTFDSTIIDLTTIDTTLYYLKYSFWQEVPIHNSDFDCLRIGDVNKNGRPELYGSRKLFSSDYEPITVYELNNSNNFVPIFQYDSVYLARGIYDVDNDGNEEVELTLPPIFETEGNQQRFFSKTNDTSLATQLNFTFFPYEFQNQLNDQTLGDFDNDGYTDLLFVRFSEPDIHIFEYNTVVNDFDSVYRFDVYYENAPWSNSGFSVGDFDLDGKTDIVFGTGKGAVYVLENEGNNKYINSWLGNVESYHAYVHTWTNDIDKNGKPEFWVLGDAYYNGVGTTRITIFETNGDNSYQAVGRIDLVGVFSFYAGTMQAVDIDNDGTDEVAVCIDGNFLLLKFNGSENHQTYEIYYIKQSKSNAIEYQVYTGATMSDLQYNGRQEILISMYHTKNNLTRYVTEIYRTDSATRVDDDGIIPMSIKLYQNYPNPFNPSTKIKFEISEYSEVTIKVYDLLGKEISTLIEKEFSPGEYIVNWEARESNGLLLPSGVYLIRLSAENKAGSYTQTIKALLLK